MRRIRLLLYCLATSLLLAEQPQPKPAFRITGLVLNARDSAPLRHAHVAATLASSARGGSFREPVRTDTDDTGHFLLELPSAGNWQVNVRAHYIRPQNFEEHEGFFSAVVLTSATPVYDLVFHAIPDAMLTGTVTDEAGEPVRFALVSLLEVDKTAAQTGGEPLQQKSNAQTDDRGHYELASLEAGSYIIEVQGARPWYANNPPSPRTGDTATLPDPSLDLVYPTTWYPGTSDIASAATLVAHPGDTLQADIRLVPAPAAHLIIPSPSPPPVPSAIPANGLSAPISGRVAINGINPNIQLLLPNGTTQPVFSQSLTRNARGDIDIGGLAPGTYQVTLPAGPDSPPRATTVQLTAGGTLTELASDQPTTPVTISVDGDSRTRASQIVLRSTLTGQTFPDFARQDFSDRGPRPQGDARTDPQRNRSTPQQRIPQPSNQPSNPRGARPGGQAPAQGGRPRTRTSGEPDEVTIQVPPGVYEVTLSGGSNAFLTGLAARGATAIGRTITISDSPVHLAVHLGAGFATVQGIASIGGKPAVGAMVLLVPATLGDPASLTIVHRDQTNTDGSFRLDSIIPGQYILIAIDHGWSVHWTDPATLAPYLLHGTPLDLHPAATTSQKLQAIAP